MKILKDYIRKGKNLRKSRGSSNKAVDRWNGSSFVLFNSQDEAIFQAEEAKVVDLLLLFSQKMPKCRDL